MANLSHAKRRALRAAVLTGGLVRADSGLFDNPQAPAAFYQPATIVGLVRDGLLVIVHQDGRNLAKATRAGLDALTDAWRPAGCAIPAGSIVEPQPA